MLILPNIIRQPLFKKVLTQHALAREPDFKIGGAENPYMNRWYVKPRNKEQNVYLHQMLRDDDDVKHDHPWRSISIVLFAPELYEKYIDWRGRPVMRRVYTGQVLYRGAGFTHQMIVPQPAWTLFMTGAVVREWGFHCPKGWVNFKDYVEKNETGSKPGRGCGEMS